MIHALACLALSTPFSTEVAERPFPFETTEREAIAGSITLAPRTEAFADLADLREVRLAGVPLPGGGEVDLLLERIAFDPNTIGVHVDGSVESRPPDVPDQSMWMGEVDGLEGTDVYLALSPAGSYGWIHLGTDLVHLLSTPDPVRDWDAPRGHLVTEEGLLSLDPEAGPRCALSDSADGLIGAPPDEVGSTTQGGLETLWCPIAIETDYQLYQVFNQNLLAEETYVIALLGAVSERYREEIEVIPYYPYLMFYTDPNDPWTSQDNGGNSGALLSEFRSAWAGQIPKNAALAHFLSGANLGGGIAYVQVLCHSGFGFAVSGNINGGVNFPVVPDANNWDFMVVAHEIGHNFGAMHTHEMCRPDPIDECPPSQYFSTCQTQQVCINNGTVMSYCHLCPGGLVNITTYFHPVIKGIMRYRAEVSCLTGDGCEVVTPYCESGANSAYSSGALLHTAGTTSLTFNDFELIANNAVPFQPGIFFYGGAPNYLSFGDGWLCVSAGSKGIYRPGAPGAADASGTRRYWLDMTQPPANSGPGEITAGATWFFQYWYRDPGGNSGFNLSHGIEVTFCP